ncbi:MAG TPA: hypothetical protein VIM57_02095 [Luteolibacter sp.]
MKPKSFLHRKLFGALATVATVTASANAATLLYSIEAKAGNEALGSAIVSLGDLNGDGFADFAVSDPKFDVTGKTTATDSGQVLIVSGRNGNILFTLRGTVAANQQFGTSLVAIQADKDSKLDLAVGAPGGNGAVYIYSGATGKLIRKITDPTPEANSLFGASLANAGDQNGDGKADLFIGAPGSNTNDGAVLVVSGATGALINEILPTAVDSRFGASIATVSDLNADGKADLAVGSPGFSSGLGQVQIVESDTGLQLDVLAGTLAGAQLGGTISAAGDRDNDGKIDLVVSSQTGGSAFLVSGATLDTITDLTLTGGAAGFPVVSGGAIDIDQDGDTELLVGYPGALPLAQVSIIPAPTLPEPNVYEAALAGSGLGSSLAVLPGLGFAVGEPLLNGGAVHVYLVGDDTDTDGDGIPDVLDHCVNSILTPTVVIGNVDTGVENVVDDDGCSIADLLEELEPENGYRNHGQFVSNAAKLFNSLRKEGLITKQEQQRLQKAAAQSDIGKKVKTK